MPITRTPIQDDDGSGTTGTTIDNAWKQQFYDQIDAMTVAGIATIAPGFRIPTWLTFDLGTVGTYNNFAPPNAANCVTWLIGGSVATRITGIPAEPIGTMHLIYNMSSGAITLGHQDAGSSAGNRFLGPDFADYTLTSWHGTWIYYSPLHSAWYVLPFK